MAGGPLRPTGWLKKWFIFWIFMGIFTLETFAFGLLAI